MDVKSQTGHKPTNEELYHNQMETLRLFRERNAISQEQYEKSVHDLTVKMGFGNNNEKS